MIVVDLGCLTHHSVDSISYLIDRFNPRVLFGFDPHPETIDRVYAEATTTVVTARKAAWVHNRGVHLNVNGSRTRVAGEGETAAASFHLCAFLDALPQVPTVLKLDIEGAEELLLHRIHDERLDERLDLILVEWHAEPLQLPFRCPVEEWTL